MTVKLLNGALTESGAPENLITMVEEPSIENINKTIENPNVRLLVATEGSSIVKKVLSSGKKTIGAGASSLPVVVDETADIVEATKSIMDGYSFDGNVLYIVEKEVFAMDSICDYLIHNMKENGAHQTTDPTLLEKLIILVTSEKGGPKTSFVGKSTRYTLDKLDITADTNVRVIIMEVPKEYLLTQEEMMTPTLPMVRVCDVSTAIEYARRVEYGSRHTTTAYSRNVEKSSKMAKVMGTTIFVKDVPPYAGIGVGGEGYTTFITIGPIGKGLTSPKAFCRRCRRAMTDIFSIRQPLYAAAYGLDMKEKCKCLMYI